MTVMPRIAAHRVPHDDPVKKEGAYCFPPFTEGRLEGLRV